MKSLYDYMSECGDGCATPLGTMGMGNPCAPDGEGVGSGDTFDHQRRTAKAKRRKKDKEVPELRKDQHVIEGMFDDDFEVSMENLLDPLLEEYAEIYKYPHKTEPSAYEDFYKRFKAHCEGIEASKMSLMKAFRSKDVTIAIFIDGAEKLGSTRKNQCYIRKFVKNPLPVEYQIYELDLPSDTYIQSCFQSRVNHPTQLNMKHMRAFILPGNAFDKIQNAIGK